MPEKVVSVMINTQTHNLDKVIFWSMILAAIAKAKINGDFAGGPRHARALDRNYFATKN